MTEQAGAAGQAPPATSGAFGGHQRHVPPTAPPAADPADRMAAVGRSRWWWIAYGVLAIAAGVLAVVWPGVSALVLSVLFGIQLLVLGIFRIVGAFAIADTSTGTKVLSILIGILALIAGIVCLRAPVGTAVLLAIVVGAFWVVNGIMEVVAGIAGRGERGRAWTIVGGVVGLVAGTVVLATPVISIVVLAWVLGIMLIVHGAVAIAASFGRPAAG